jgi:hypothetical protein
MSFSASAAVDLSDPEAVRALLAAQARELALKDQLLAEKDAELARKDAEIVARDERLCSREEQIEHLKLVIAKLRRDAYGAKSEKVDRNVDQLELKLEELETDQAADEAAERIASDRPIKNKPVRKPLPEHLTREVVTHTPTERSCPDCGGKLRKLGEDLRVPGTHSQDI